MTRSLYVCNIPYEAGERELKEFFSRYGEVAGAVVSRDPETRQSLGYGFVEMDEINAEAALAASGEMMGRRRIKVEYALTRRKNRGGIMT